MNNYAMFIDYKYCTGCHACELSCRNEKGLGLGEWGIKVNEQGPLQIDGKWNWDYVPVPWNACDLCEERRAQGKKAACELHCLAACLEIVPFDQIEEKLKTAGEKAMVYVR